MNEAIQRLAKAMGRPEEEVLTALNDTDLALVWDPERVMPAAILGVHMTVIQRDGKQAGKWWTLKALDKGKFTNRGTGEVHKWKA